MEFATPLPANWSCTKINKNRFTCEERIRKKASPLDSLNKKTSQKISKDLKGKGNLAKAADLAHSVYDTTAAENLRTTPHASCGISDGCSIPNQTIAGGTMPWAPFPDDCEPLTLQPQVRITQEKKLSSSANFSKGMSHCFFSSGVSTAHRRSLMRTSPFSHSFGATKAILAAPTLSA